MISGRRTAKDLVEEAKKRVVLLLICVFGLSYLMSFDISLNEEVESVSLINWAEDLAEVDLPFLILWKRNYNSLNGGYSDISADI